MQLCQCRQHCVPTNGKHLFASNVEYGTREGAKSDYEKAGYQYLRQVVSGLDVNNVSFAVSPPYFENSSPEDKVCKWVNIILRDFTAGCGQYLE
jgi:hypothetical protein